MEEEKWAPVDRKDQAKQERQAERDRKKAEKAARKKGMHVAEEEEMAGERQEAERRFS